MILPVVWHIKLLGVDGVLDIALPGTRETGEPFHSCPGLLPREGHDAPGRLVRAMYVRGLSTRDVEALFLEAFREEVLSRSGVSGPGKGLQSEFDRWRRRDLSGLAVVYLFLDAVCLAVRQGSKDKGV